MKDKTFREKISKELKGVYGAGFLANELGKELEDDEEMLKTVIEIAEAQILQLMLDVVGEDEKVSNPPEHCVDCQKESARNQLRKEVRSAIGGKE